MADKFITSKSEKVKPTFVPSKTRLSEYQRTYDRLVERARGREHEIGEHDRHHIIPKSLGGSNYKSNIVCLTYREHFLAHWLLTKITEGKSRRKMLYAFHRLIQKNEKQKTRIFSGWQYAVARRAKSEVMRGNKNGRKLKGRKQSPENIAKISKGLLGNTHRRGKKSKPETIEKNRKRMMGNQYAKGMTHSDEFRIAQSARMSLKNRGNTYAKNLVDHPSICRRVWCITDGKEFSSIRRAAEYYGINEVGVNHVLLGHQKTTGHKKYSGGLRFEYIEETNEKRS